MGILSGDGSRYRISDTALGGCFSNLVSGLLSSGTSPGGDRRHPPPSK